ncbi:TyeA family type III secretion system gatekeeper subunit [Dongshaea marina]|uniref:TyeA family type III secretion system gatekeeper subunit n=1 Tax=Dongshaea marina TaxID=2047966 RepID=UPI000D3E2A72|nr:TyeA family type III secretion system gatekeeper subunit [Dongshaea marina]
MDNQVRNTFFTPVLDYEPVEEGQEQQGFRQNFPGQSIQESVQAALVDIREGALEETMEEASLALGGKLKDLKRGKDAPKSELDKSKELLQRLIQQIAGVDLSQLSLLAAKYPGVSEAADPLMFLRQAGACAAEIALVLGFLLADQGLSRSQRKRLQQALDSLLQEEQALGVELFAYLEFGAATPKVMAQLEKIYQKACDSGLQLPELFHQLKDLPQRNKKVKALIRGLAFELSSEGEVAQGSKLATVVNDLRRLLLFFGLDTQCDQIAVHLTAQGAQLSGLEILEELVLLIEQSWVYPDWIESRINQLELESIGLRLSYCRHCHEVIKFMPEPCFSDEDQREQILDTLSELLENYADSE